MEEIILNYIGWLAVIAISLQFIPQVLRVYYPSKKHPVSILTYSVASLGAILWFIHGYYRKDYAIMVANTMVFICTLFIIFGLIKQKNT